MPRKTLPSCSVLAVLLVAGVLLGTGCATRSRAETRAPVAEPLRVPNVPPRVIAGPPEPEASLPTDTIEVTDAEAPPTSEADSTRKPAPRSERGAATEKPRATSSDRAAADSEAKPESESILSTPQTLNDKATERKIREAMQRASGDLKRLNFAALNDNAKKDYRNAESFLRQAGAALANRNLSMASDQADKAEKLARGLTQRSSGSV